MSTRRGPKPNAAAAVVVAVVAVTAEIAAAGGVVAAAGATGTSQAWFTTQALFIAQALLYVGTAAPGCPPSPAWLVLTQLVSLAQVRVGAGPERS